MAARLNDHGKLIVLVAIIASATILAALDKLPGSIVELLLVGVFGYVSGNGVLAVQKRPPSPLLSPVVAPVGPGTGHPEHPAHPSTPVEPRMVDGHLAGDE